MREYFISASTSPSTRPMPALIKPSSSVIPTPRIRSGRYPSIFANWKSPTSRRSVRRLDLIGLHVLRDQRVELAGAPHPGDEAVDIIAHLGVALPIAVADLACAHVERLVVAG